MYWSGIFGDSFGVLNALFSGLALAGVIYTLNLHVRTFELQRKDSAFNIMPLLAVEPKSGVRNGYHLVVTNIGNGTAMNIDLEPFSLASDFPLVFKLNKPMTSMNAGRFRRQIIRGATFHFLYQKPRGGYPSGFQTSLKLS